MYQDAGMNQIKPATAKEIRYAKVSGSNAVPDMPVVGYERVTVTQESNGTTNGKEVLLTETDLGERACLPIVARYLTQEMECCFLIAYLIPRGNLSRQQTTVISGDVLTPDF